MCHSIIIFIIISDAAGGGGVGGVKNFCGYSVFEM
jgi:hypothetical protein